LFPGREESGQTYSVARQEQLRMPSARRFWSFDWLRMVLLVASVLFLGFGLPALGRCKAPVRHP